MWDDYQLNEYFFTHQNLNVMQQQSTIRSVWHSRIKQIKNSKSIIKKESFTNRQKGQPRLVQDRQMGDSSNQQSQHQSDNQDAKPILTLIHFNDVYDIQRKKNQGGVVNFKAKLEQLRQAYDGNVLVLFSGDAFSPSILSQNKKGWQMVKALNSLSIDAACFGNHEFDFQQQHTKTLSKSCNITRIDNGKILGDGIPYIIFTTRSNLRVGIFGVAGADWLSIMNEQYQQHYQCQDPQQYSIWMSNRLKYEQNCDLIIALTHMRNGDDLDLAQTPSSIDIILGGHDHVIINRCVQMIPVIKSGTNFEQIGVVEIWGKYLQYEQQHKQVHYHSHESPTTITQHTPKNPNEKRYYLGKNFTFSCQILQIPNAQPLQIDTQLDAYVKLQMDDYKKQDKILGYAECPLQARFKIIRTQESNYGNFFVDLFRLYYAVDVAVLNSGCIRNDVVMGDGCIKYSKLTNIIDDVVIVKLLPGFVIYKMLQYAVKGLPHSFMGSFLLISGIKFKYDLTKTPRVQQVLIGDKLIEMDRMYTVAMPSYMGNGADGYEFVKQYTKVVDEVRAISIINVLLKFFEAIDSKVQVSQKHQDLYYHSDRLQTSRFQRIKALRSKFIQIENGQKIVCINPQTDQRIVCLNN